MLKKIWWGKRGANFLIEKRNRLKFKRLRFFKSDSYRTQTCNLLIRSQMLYSIELRSRVFLELFFLFYDAALGLFDAGLLALEVAEVEDAGPADLTDLVDLDAVDER